MKKINLNTVLFYIFWTILMVSKGLGMASSTHSNYIYVLGVACVFAAAKMLFTTWTKDELFKVFIINMLGLLIFVKTGEASVLLLTITLSSLKNINLKNLIKFTAFLLAMFFVVRTTLAIFGVINPQRMVRYDLGDIHTVRYGLGFGQPNVTQSMLFIVYSLFIIFYKDRIKLLHYILMLIYCIFIFSYTNSRTGLIVTCVLLMLSYFSKSNINIRKILYIISQKSYLICIVLSLIIIFFLPYIVGKFNLGTFWARFITGSNIINNYNLTLLGSKNIDIDLGYVGVLYEKGIIFFILFYYYCSKLLNKLIKTKEIYFVIYFFCIVIYTFLESYFDSILMNIPLIYLSLYIFGSKGKEDINENNVSK